MKLLPSTLLTAAFLCASSAIAGFGWVPEGPPPKPYTKIISEGHSFPVTYYTPEDPQLTAAGSSVDDRVQAQEVYRGLQDYILNLGPLVQLLYDRRSDPSFHWIDLGGGSGRPQIEAHFSRPVDAYAEYVYDRRKRQFDPPDPQTVDFFKRPDGNPRLVNLFQSPWNRELTVDELASAKLVGPFRTTNISWDDVMTPTLEDRETFRGLNLAPGFDRIRAIFKLWAPQLVRQGLHRNLTGRLFQDIPEEEIGAADVITDRRGVLTYGVNKFEILTKIVRLLKPGGLFIFNLDNDQRIRIEGHSTSYGGFRLREFLAAAKLPGFTNPPDGYATLQALPGTLEMLEKLSRRVTRAEVGSEKTYYRPPPGTVLWLTGVKVEFLPSMGGTILKSVELVEPDACAKNLE